jgi:hypothetical protein
MAVAAFKLKPKPKLRTFYATVHVTRVEEWCVEARKKRASYWPRATVSGRASGTALAWRSNGSRAMTD